MPILLASDQYNSTKTAISATNAANDAIMLGKYGDVFTQITYASNQGLYSTSYILTDLSDSTAFIAMLNRAGYTVTQSETIFNISWLFVTSPTTASVLPTNSTGYLSNNGGGQLSWTAIPTSAVGSLGLVSPDGSSIKITAFGVISVASNYSTKAYATALAVAMS